MTQVLASRTPRRDHAQVLAPPPLVFVPTLIAGIVLHQFTALRFFPEIWAGHAVGWPLIAAAGLLVAWAVLTFRRAGEKPSVYEPTKTIVATGPYGVTRNPMYVAMVLLYSSIALVTNSVWPMVFLPAPLIFLHYGVILREERYLQQKFGEEFRRYRSRVRRWL